MTKPTYTPEEVGALPDTTFIPTKVSDIDNDLEFVQKSVFDTSVDGKMSMTNRSGSAYIGWMDPNIFFGVGSFSFGKDCIVDQYFSFAIGYKTQASGRYSHSEGSVTKATGEASHAEGYNTTAAGYFSHAEGDRTTASGQYSHAEGYNTTASVSCSHAEGDSTTASGFYSHSEGGNTIASGVYSHAEGAFTIAGGSGSHAEGFKSHATNKYSFAWNGDVKNTYGSHGDGTFNINPVGGVDGFYIGEKNLKTIITEVSPGGGGGGGVSDARVGEIATNCINHLDAHFASEVLAVQIDTNTVAQIGELKEFFDGLPVGTVGTSLGGLVLALLAAVAWLKKHKIEWSDAESGAMSDVFRADTELSDCGSAQDVAIRKMSQLLGENVAGY